MIQIIINVKMTEKKKKFCNNLRFDNLCDWRFALFLTVSNGDLFTYSVGERHQIFAFHHNLKWY